MNTVNNENWQIETLPATYYSSD